MKKLIHLFIIIFCLTSITYAQSVKKYSPQEVKDDLKYMYDILEKSSYDLFALNSKENMDKMYSNIYHSINDSLSRMGTFRLFKPFVASVKMSHCFMYYPWQEFINDYAKNGGTVFPMNICFADGKVLVKNNFSTNQNIDEYDEITAINGKSIEQFMDDFHKYLSGPSKYFNNALIERRLFPRLYWYFYDEQQSFPLTIRKKDGQVLELIVKAIPVNEFEEKNKNSKPERKRERKFDFLKNKTAYLLPGEFINYNSNSDMNAAETWDNTEFCQFIDSAFNIFNKKNIKNLIIDLRDNMGGDNSFSDYMIAYFADTTFRIASSMRMKTSQHTKDIWKDIDIPEVQDIKKQIMSLENGSRFDAPIPQTDPHLESKRFKGNVYVLINRYSYSNTAMTACIIQDYGFGEIIGEETTDEVSSYGALHVFELPNTKWTVSYPKAFFIRPNGDPTPRGVVPDHIMIDDLTTAKDEILEYTLKLIESK